MIILYIFALCFVVGMACNIRKNRPPKPKPAPVEIDEKLELHEINLDERRETLDTAIGKYYTLLNVLEKAINAENDPKKRSTLLLKEINTLEKLNRTLEKREKLDL